MKRDRRDNQAKTGDQDRAESVDAEQTNSFLFLSSPPGGLLSTPTPSLKDFLETAGKIFLGIAGLSYVTGLVVVTVHLREYGLNSLILSQLHYVMAGIWALLPIVVAMFLITVAVHSVLDELQRTKARTRRQGESRAPAGSPPNELSISWVKFASKMFMAAVFPVGIFVVLLALLAFTGIKFGWNWLLVLFVGAIVGTFAIGIGYLWRGSSPSRSTPNLIAMGAATSLGLLFFFAYVVLFSKLSYKNIPWSTGGGGSSQVQLVVTNDAKPLLESAGLKFYEGKNRTDSLSLLLATDREYIIVNQAGKAVSVPAGSVQSVIYEK